MKYKPSEELIVGIIVFNGQHYDQIKYYVTVKDARIVDEGYGRYDGTYFYDESCCNPLKQRYPITFQEFERLHDIGIKHGISMEEEIRIKAIELLQKDTIIIDE